MAFAAKDAAFVNFVAFFYTQVAGLSGTLYGIAAFVGQLSDAITDPIFGTLSDNARSRWGRVLPWSFCFGWITSIRCLIEFLVAFRQLTGIGYAAIPRRWLDVP